jgi:acyl transferase domain-containing protein/NAD(P)-dependent dehydrogenase (short-subunit alcohol dehydrogenase family)
VIKMTMAMRAGVLPRTLHVDEPSSKVDWEAGKVELLTEAREWQTNGRPRRAGVSSFGISGTNAHVILEAAPETSAVETNEEGTEGKAEPAASLTGQIPLGLSAKTEPALAEMAANLASHLRENPDLDPADVAFSLATTRSAFEHRAVALGKDREELLDALASIAAGADSPRAIRARAKRGKLVYLFGGQGSQRLGMGQELYESNPAFRDAFEEACAQLDPHLEEPLAPIVFAEGKKAEGKLDHTAYAQPALFALELALYRALASQGLEPDLLAGHSIGELAAARIAGVLDLPQAARLVAARGKLMGALPEGGAMLAIEASEEEARGYLEGKEAAPEIAAINGPAATVLSGTEEAIEKAKSHFEEQGRKTKRLAVSHAFHSPLIDPMLTDFEAIARELDYREPRIPIASNLTGELLTAEQATDPAYWVAQARSPVRFADVIATLVEQGASAYVELGADPVLAPMAQQCLEAEGKEAATIATLREGREERDALAAAIARAQASGAKLDWGAFFEGAKPKRVPLPTYPFQRKRYWVAPRASASDPTAIGQTDAEHPLLAAAIEDPEGEGLILTGRLSLETHPWLADHAVASTVLLPGTAFVELALRAAEQVGARTISELTLQAPLVLSEQGSVQIRVSVAPADEDGNRAVSVHSRPQAGGEAGEWTANASGVLAREQTEGQEPLSVWPPEGAEPLEIEGLYERLAEAGFEYGPAFQSLTAAWRRGEEVYAEVSLAPEQREEAGRYGVHPALLDSTLHAVADIVLAERGEDGKLVLPFAWNGIALRAAGARALRAKIAPVEGGYVLDAFEESGALLASVASVLARPVELSRLQSEGRDRGDLLGIEWQEVSLPGAEDDTEVELWRAERDPGADADAAKTAAARALAAVQEWLAAEHLPAARLALITEGAMATEEGESVNAPAASIWGLVRSAQAEHPGRFVLIDSDGSDVSEEAMPAALASEEPQLALREGKLLAPRAVRIAGDASEQSSPIDPERTVLITGATGGLGALVARRLVEGHGVRRLLLASRRGEKAEGMVELKAELGELGAEVEIAACNVSDREQLEGLLARVPREHSLGAVIHAAGVVSDGLIETLDAERMERVFAPKANAAWHLHELTRDMDLSAFVLFSSAAGTLGAPGQAGYAAANAFLDALAEERRAKDLPATAIAWGLWRQDKGMTAELGEADLARLSRSGLAALDTEQGLELFDRALAAPTPAPIALRLDAAGLRSQAAAGLLAPILSALVRTPRRRRGSSGSLATKVAALPEAEREQLVLNLVRGEVAAVLGHGSVAEVVPERAFKEMGFDSLAAVELRNRLAAATGIALSATVVFDYPGPAKLAGHLLAEATASGPSRRAVVRARANDEPIAIVGMACRYPGGVASPEELWRLLAEGRDGIDEFPVDRGWDLENLFHPDPDQPETSYTRQGGFIDRPAEFDAEFFGIGPREALAMDPQQRLLLEASWEALETAGIDPPPCAESRPGSSPA